MALPLVLLPGLLCDRAAWAEVIRWLDRDRDCLVPDYGVRDTLAGMAVDVLAAAPARFAVAGHSMGGRVALEMLRRAPERIAGLALLDTATHARAAGEAGAREEAERLALLDLARLQGMRVMGRRWAEPMVHPSRLADAGLMNAILDMIERKTPDIFAAQIRALLARPEAGPLLPGVKCPALVLCGREDSWATLARHEAMASAIPGCRLVVVERCGHMAPMERPEAVAGALSEWLRAIAGAEAERKAAPAQPAGT
jgi:pimeloyl-ACP methyl ester carboxylesterase